MKRSKICNEGERGSKCGGRNWNHKHNLSSASSSSSSHGGFAIETAAPEAPWLQGSQHLRLLHRLRPSPSTGAQEQASPSLLLQAQEEETQLLQNLLLRLLFSHPLPHRRRRSRPCPLLPNLRPQAPRLPPPRLPDLLL